MSDCLNTVHLPGVPHEGPCLFIPRQYPDYLDDPIPSGHDPVNHPVHYTTHPAGIEVIEVTEHLNFCLGNVIKLVLRADHKGAAIEDLRKAAWYLRREIERRERDAA